ncbi:MAG: hypothetical protein ACLVAA_08200 [Ruthenibacterium sp.]
MEKHPQRLCAAGWFYYSILRAGGCKKAYEKAKIENELQRDIKRKQEISKD